MCIRDSAITLSLGERDEQSYRRLMEAGADRYLLRHETASEAHYATLHPPELRLAHRVACLYTLKRLGYQVGSGFMVGSPGPVSYTHLDVYKRQPHIVPGIGVAIAVKVHDSRQALRGKEKVAGLKVLVGPSSGNAVKKTAV